MNIDLFGKNPIGQIGTFNYFFSTFVTDIGLCLINSHIYNDILMMIIFYGQLSCKINYVISCNESKGKKISFPFKEKKHFLIVMKNLTLFISYFLLLFQSDNFLCQTSLNVIINILKCPKTKSKYIKIKLS